MRRQLLRHVLYPAWHWAKRDGVNRALRECEANQWLSLSEVLALQRNKLAELLKFSQKNVPYYRHALRRVEISENERVDTECLLHIPPLSKATILSKKQLLVSEDLTGIRLFDNSTSGSTGEALRFYTDSRSMPYRVATLLRGDSWAGWQLGDRVVRLWGAPMDERISTGLRGKLHGWVTGDLFLSSFVLSDTIMGKYARLIRRFQPILMVAYPGPLEQFAIYCRERDIKFESLRGIVSSAETLWPYQRRTIEEAFGVSVFDRYGSREVSQIASECEEHAGLHISADRLIVEVVDEDGRPCRPGEVGRILVTDLDNFGMPLIRYDIGDRGALAEHTSCKCGRGLPRLQTVEGRSMDIIRTADGRSIGGTFWTLALKSRPGIRQFQIVQDTTEGIVILFVRDNDFKPEVLAYFTVRIQKYCGSGFSVDFVEKDSIDLTGSGKRRLILSNLEQQALRKDLGSSD